MLVNSQFPNYRCEAEVNIGVATITQVTHLCNKNSNIKGRSLDVVKVIFYTIRNCS